MKQNIEAAQQSPGTPFEATRGKAVFASGVTAFSLISLLMCALGQNYNAFTAGIILVSAGAFVAGAMKTVEHSINANKEAVIEAVKIAQAPAPKTPGA